MNNKPISSRYHIVNLGTKGASPGFTYSICEELTEANLLETITVSDRQDLLVTFEIKIPSKKLYKLKIANSAHELLDIRGFARLLIHIMQQGWAKEGRAVFIYPMHHPWSIAAVVLTWPYFNHYSIVHDARPHEGANWLLEMAQLFLVYTFSKKIYFLSSIQAKYAEQFMLPFQAKRIEVINHPSFRHYSIPASAYTEKEYKQASADPGEAGKYFDFLFFGRLEKYKGMKLLIDSFTYYVRRYDSNATLLIAGRQGSVSLGDLEGLKGITMLSRYIPDKDIPLLFGCSSTTLLPYTSATQSGVMTLAADHNSPCAATPLPGLVEQAVYTSSRVIFSQSFSYSDFGKAMFKARTSEDVDTISRPIHSNLVRSILAY